MARIRRHRRAKPNGGFTDVAEHSRSGTAATSSACADAVSIASELHHIDPIPEPQSSVAFTTRTFMERRARFLGAFDGPSAKLDELTYRTASVQSPVEEGVDFDETRHNVENYLASLPSLSNDPAGVSHEEAIIVAPDGRIVEHRIGTEFQVIFSELPDGSSERSVLSGDFTDCAIFHNHPSGAALSFDDLKVGAFGDVESIHAVTDHGTFSAYRVYSVESAEPDSFPHSLARVTDIQQTYTAASEYINERSKAAMDKVSPRERIIIHRAKRKHEHYVVMMTMNRLQADLKNDLDLDPSWRFSYEPRGNHREPPGSETFLDRIEP